MKVLEHYTGSRSLSKPNANAKLHLGEAKEISVRLQFPEYISSSITYEYIRLFIKDG